jgi:hypothetical protein
LLSSCLCLVLLAELSVYNIHFYKHCPIPSFDSSDPITIALLPSLFPCFQQSSNQLTRKWFIVALYNAAKAESKAEKDERCSGTNLAGTLSSISSNTPS